MNLKRYKKPKLEIIGDLKEVTKGADVPGDEPTTGKSPSGPP